MSALAEKKRAIHDESRANTDGLDGVLPRRSLRKTKLPRDSWRVNDPGHFHIKK